MSDYVHGYDDVAGTRLGDQARVLESVIHDGVRYPDTAHVLEIGCGVGSQTQVLLRNNDGTKFTAIDTSLKSLESAREVLGDASHRLRLHFGDACSIEYEDNSFDHAFVCFVLEHLADPRTALEELRRVVKPGGTLTVIEGDHGSVVMHPHSDAALAAVGCQMSAQERAGGDACIGRRLYPLLRKAGFRDVVVEPRQVYADGSRPDLQEGFVVKTFTAMIEGVRDDALCKPSFEPDAFDKGIAALYDAAGRNGTFSYTFYKAIAIAA